MPWEHFPHDADIGVAGLGESLPEAFAQAALGLTAIITDPARVQPAEEVSVRCRAPDPELLLVDWLNALVFEMATRRMLFSRFEVELDGEELRGTAWGERVDVLRHRPAVEIKGATYTGLSVKKTASGAWRAQCVVDV
jgi:SHS2 domain-containing protein